MSGSDESVPYFRASIGDEEIEEVVSCLRSGWITTGSKTALFEANFAAALGRKHAVAVNSCTAALHLALEALGTSRGDMVLVPALTFTATAEVVRYFDATPVFVDCDVETLCIDPQQVERTLEALAEQIPVAGLKPPYGPVRAIIPMHYAGQMADMLELRRLAKARNIPMISDAAHAFPAAIFDPLENRWANVGEIADVACFSFYANKCITTGEGGMAVTDSDELAARMRTMSLHGLSKDAWRRFQSNGSWDYEVVAPGFKYNLTDIAASLGLVQLRRAEAFRQARAAIAQSYNSQLPADFLQLPSQATNRQHAWHLYVVRIKADCLAIDRDAFVRELSSLGVGTSVHWRPLHLQPYYAKAYGLAAGLFPQAEQNWKNLISLPIFPSMTEAQVHRVVTAVKEIVQRFSLRRVA